MKNGRVSRVMNQPASCTLVSGAGKYLHGDAESEMICPRRVLKLDRQCQCVVFVFVSRTFVYIPRYVFTDHLLVSFTYHLPVGLSVSEAARVRAHFDFFFEWFSKGSLQKYMNEPCFSFGCVVRLPLFFLVVQYLRG